LRPGWPALIPQLPSSVFLGKAETSITPREAFKAWQNVLSDYGQSSVTYDEDKLIAIAGVSKRFDKPLGLGLGQFAAGLWLEFLVEGLRWTVEPRKIFRKRPSYRAPSWSWAAVNGSLPMSAPQPDALLARGRGLIVEVLDGKIPYAETIRGTVIVDGPFLRNVSMGLDRLQPFGYYLSVHRSGDLPGEEEAERRIGIGQLDPGTWPAEVTFHCLGLVRRKEETSEETESILCDGLLLILGQEDGMEKFVRTGWFRGFNAFNELAEQETVFIG